MSKPKSPLLSLEAHGTVGNALTFQRRSGVDFVREKPTPADPQALAQMYQRWRVQDYALLWHAQSDVQKAAWRAAGSRLDITGYNAFLRDRLSTLPDIIAEWHLDEPGGAVAHDSGPNSINGTVFGASPYAGRINGARHFDKIDDYVDCTNNPLLHITTPFSFEAWIYPIDSGEGGWGRAFDIAGTFACFMNGAAVQDMRWSFNTSTGWHNVDSAGNAALWGTRHHVVCVYSGTSTTLFIDKNSWVNPAVTGITNIIPADKLYVGNRFLLDRTWSGWIDHVVYYNRALTQADVDRRYERRYPL